MGLDLQIHLSLHSIRHSCWIGSNRNTLPKRFTSTDVKLWSKFQLNENKLCTELQPPSLLFLFVVEVNLMSLKNSVMAEVLPWDWPSSSNIVMNENVLIKRIEFNFFTVQNLLPDILESERFIPFCFLSSIILNCSLHDIFSVYPLNVWILLTEGISIREPLSI